MQRRVGTHTPRRAHAFSAYYRSMISWDPSLNVNRSRSMM